MRRVHVAMVMAWVGVCIACLVVGECVSAARRARGKKRAKSRRARVLSGRHGQAGAQTSRKSISASK